MKFRAYGKRLAALRRHLIIRYQVVAAMGCLLVSTGASSAFDTQTAKQVAQRVEARYNGAKSLSAEFEEEYSFSGHKRPMEAGTLILQKKGKMRWAYAQPAGKLFIVNGQTAILYSAASHRLEKTSVRETDDVRAPLGFLLGHLDLTKEFKDLKLEPGDGGSWLACRAKNDRLAYSQVRMLVAPDSSIRQLSITGANGAQTDFRFSGERLNVPVPAGVFRFDIPPGTEIVDTPQLGAEGN